MNGLRGGTVWKTSLSAVLALFLAACATTGNFCDVAGPIRPSALDQMTDGTKRQILAHNEFGAHSCGWR